MARINKIQKYAALWLSSNGLSINEISKELKLSDNQIKNAIKDNITDKPPPSQQNSSVKNMMITKSEGGKYNVAVMTKAASEVNDEKAKVYRKQAKPNDNIFKPLG